MLYSFNLCAPRGAGAQTPSSSSSGFGLAGRQGQALRVLPSGRILAYKLMLDEVVPTMDEVRRGLYFSQPGANLEERDSIAKPH